MKHQPIYIIIGVGVLLLFAACGRQQQAKSVVKAFMAEQLHREDVSYIDFSSVDSTHTFNDSLIGALRQHGPKDVSYQPWQGRTLLHIRAKYRVEQDTCSTTFYLDPEATGVVAFKDN